MIKKYIVFNNLKGLRVFSFISSMFPLSIFLVLDYWGDNYKLLKIKFFVITPFGVTLTILFFEIISVIYIVKFFHNKSETNEFENYKTVKLKNIKQEKINASNYLLANVLPIVTLNYNDFRIVIFSMLLIASLGLMYYKNNLYYLNPIYDLINVKVYNCEVVELDQNDKEIKNSDKVVLSKINLYNFKHINYRIVEDIDAIFIVKKIN